MHANPNHRLTYEQENGGFVFSKFTPATREDTYYALRSLNLINYQYPGNKILDYIKQLIPKQIINIKNFYQLLYIVSTYDLEFHIQHLSNLIERSELNYHNLSDLYYYIRSKILLNLPLTQRIFEIVAGYPTESLRDLPNTVKYIILISLLNISYDKEYFLSYLSRCQSGDGRYGFLLGSTSFLENVCYVLRAYKYLQSPPKHTDKILAFIQHY